MIRLKGIPSLEGLQQETPVVMHQVREDMVVMDEMKESFGEFLDEIGVVLTEDEAAKMAEITEDGEGSDQERQARFISLLNGNAYQKVFTVLLAARRAKLKYGAENPKWAKVHVFVRAFYKAFRNKDVEKCAMLKDQFEELRSQMEMAVLNQVS